LLIQEVERWSYSFSQHKTPITGCLVSKYPNLLRLVQEPTVSCTKLTTDYTALLGIGVTHRPRTTGSTAVQLTIPYSPLI